MARRGLGAVLRNRVSGDRPYEYNEPAVRWFDNVALSDNDKRKIGRDNVRRLFRLS